MPRPAIAAQIKSAIAEKITPPPVVVVRRRRRRPSRNRKPRRSRTEPPKVAVATVAPAPECKQDEARLSKIRANPSHADLAALERDLSCERLRPQIVRLRESLPKDAPKDAPKPDQPAVAANPPVLQSAQSAPAAAGAARAGGSGPKL